MPSRITLAIAGRSLTSITLIGWLVVLAAAVMRVVSRMAVLKRVSDILAPPKLRFVDPADRCGSARCRARGQARRAHAVPRQGETGKRRHLDRRSTSSAADPQAARRYRPRPDSRAAATEPAPACVELGSRIGRRHVTPVMSTTRAGTIAAVATPPKPVRASARRSPASPARCGSASATPEPAPAR